MLWGCGAVRTVHLKRFLHVMKRSVLISSSRLTLSRSEITNEKDNERAKRAKIGRSGTLPWKGRLWPSPLCACS